MKGKDLLFLSKYKSAPPFAKAKRGNFKSEPGFKVGAGFSPHNIQQ
jgi:hypothetical protein